ncbi:hypothetical protein MVEN_01326400 [Mycena venus]|uniref:Uncharacterized protein n=1 Tax=Mycena venus TaxID=2733690 RepID=A0A8H7CU10_9AGAR|nr:hypothetical protein MVEN_01326400 [Mycena venus]
MPGQSAPFMVMSSSAQESAVVGTTDAPSGPPGQRLLYVVLSVVAQTFFFGVYTLLIFLSTRMLLKRGLKIRTNVIMLLITLCTYFMSAAFWIYSVLYAADLVLAQIDLSLFKVHSDKITKWYTLFNAVVMVNYVLGDGVVVWRAWVICQRHLRRYLCVAMGFLGLTAVAIFLTIAFRIVALIRPAMATSSKHNILNPGIDILQLSTGVLSLLSNLTSTTVVGVTAWRHRRILRDAFTDEDATTRSDQILALVVEVGTFYCFSTLIALLAALIRLPYGTLGDLYSPINVQIAGAYPPIVILLVSAKRSLNETTFSDSSTHGSSSAAYPIQFGPNRDASPTTTVDGTEFVRVVAGDDKRKPFL